MTTTTQTTKHSAVPCAKVEEHSHQHGKGCGHEAVEHGDHVDYKHDGHLHRMHGDHVDSCGGPTAQTAAR